MICQLHSIIFLLHGNICHRRRQWCSVNYFYFLILSPSFLLSVYLSLFCCCWYNNICWDFLQHSTNDFEYYLLAKVGNEKWKIKQELKSKYAHWSSNRSNHNKTDKRVFLIFNPLKLWMFWWRRTYVYVRARVCVLSHWRYITLLDFTAFHSMLFDAKHNGTNQLTSDFWLDYSTNIHKNHANSEMNEYHFTQR